MRTGHERVTSPESSAALGRGRAVETDAHRSRIGHELTWTARSAKIVNLLLPAADGNVGGHVIGAVAAA